MMAFGLPLVPSSIGMFIINYGDRYFLKHFTNLEEVGVYSLGFKFGYMLSYLVLQPFMLIWDAKMYEIYKQPDAQRIFGRIFTYLVVALVFVALGMALFIDDFVKLMADKPFWRASEIVPLILVAYVFQGFYYFFQVGLYIKDRTKHVGAVIFGTSFATLALQYLLIRQMGSMGAAAAAIGSYFTMSVLMFVVSQRFYRISYETRRVLVLFVAALGIYFIHGTVDFQTMMARLAWSSIMAASFPFLLLVLRFFHPEEIAAGKKLVSARLGKFGAQKGVSS
jgi:O-antigen/teichoic acid export membrane protein